MKQEKTALFISVVVLLFTIGRPALADIDVRDADAEMYPANVSYDASVPTPESFLGFELGAHPVRHHQLVDYITTVAEASDRMTVEVIGYSHERRPILFLVVSSPENHARIDDIRAQHVARTEPGQSQDHDADAPIVTWLNYGVHGAEASGMDASLPFVYYLAAAQGDGIERILADSVILITAVFNPDGHSQRVSWEDAWGGQLANSDPAHIEHQHRWQHARTNHYGFDLNRQWLLLTQPEPRAWMRKWHEWRPNLTVDYHEMGGGQTYYFHPGVSTRTNPLALDEGERLMAETTRTSAAFMDSEARLYFRGEAFDNYYVGKGSTFPLLNGGVGILYEAGATRGRELETSHGLRTFRENIRKQFRTSIASIEAGLALRSDYLAYQRDFYASALDEAEGARTRAWLFTAPGDPVRLHLFADLLDYHRIDAHRPSRDLTIDGRLYPASESLLVSVEQPQYRLIRSIFETVDEFEDSTFYDVSTWTMPPAFGLQYTALGRGDYRDSLLGELHVPEMPSVEDPQRADFAYAFEYGGYYAPRALHRLLADDLLVRVAMEPFSVHTTDGVRELPSGSIVVPFDRQEMSRDSIHELMLTIAREDRIDIHAITSGQSPIGTAGIEIGGPSFGLLEQPRVLLLTGDSINLYDFGEIWHLLDYRMRMPVTLRDRDSLGGIDWSRYTHIVFPSGDYDEYLPDYADRLRQWIAEGGTALAFRDASPWLRSMTLDYVDPESEEAMAAMAAAPEEEEEEEPVERTPYGDKDALEAVDIIGGAIFAADLDVTHPLGFGYGERDIHLHKNVEQPMESTMNPFGTVIAYSDDPVVSGYVSDDNAEALAGTAALIAERSGAGSVILFADNPNFRGYWYGTNKLFMNSLFFSTLFERPDDIEGHQH